MSSTLSWEPTKRDKETLSDELKFALRKAFDDPVDITLFAYSHREMLQGMYYSGITDAKKLITAMDQHKSIRVKEEW